MTDAGAAPDLRSVKAIGIETKGPAGVIAPAAEASSKPRHPDSSPSADETHSRGIKLSASPATRNDNRITSPKRTKSRAPFPSAWGSEMQVGEVKYKLGK